ncbi:MAG TPA: serine hydrolase [Candidatus Saccharimonadales bacterium]
MPGRTAKTNKVSESMNDSEHLHLRIHSRVRHHYYRVMPGKKHHRAMIWVVFLLYIAIAAGQMLYPLDRALPLAQLGEERVGWLSHDELASKLNTGFQATRLKLKTAGKVVEYPIGSAGAELQTEAMIQAVTEYPFWERFVPFSVLWQPVQRETQQVEYSSFVLQKFGNEQAKLLSIAPKDAHLAIKRGKLTAENDISGQTVVASKVIEAIKKETPGFSGTVTVAVPAKLTHAPVRAADFAEVKQQAETALARTVSIEAAGQVFEIAPSEIANWLVIGADKQKQPVLKFDKKRFGKYLDTLDKKVGVKEGVTNISIVNGIETGRSSGKPGKVINRPLINIEVHDWVLMGTGTGYITAQFVKVAPKVIYNSRYTATEDGLRAYVRDKSRQMDVHIAIRQITGERWTASARAEDSIPSASTYKLYVAKWLFDQMDKGKVSWNDPMLDTTVSGCFDRMTIASTNPCALEWLRQAGRENMNRYVYGLGFSHGTSFTQPDATHTTANDLLRFMTMLNDGSIASGTHRDRLLHSLSVHPYRYGIPTGSKGRVWDKVGFLWDYVHDAAIVKHPKGTYVMIVMTKGQSYARIAEITREVEKIMYP